MQALTLNINVNLNDDQVNTICSTIACLAQIIDTAARTVGTPFPSTTCTCKSEPKPEEPAPEAFEQEPDIQDEPAPEEKVAPAPKSEHTHEDVRNLVIVLTDAGKKKAAVKVVKAFAPSVSDLKAEDLDTVYGQLAALEG